MENKVYGLESDFQLIRQDGSRVVVAYGLSQLSDDEKHYTWYEVYLPKRQTPQLSFDVVKAAIIGDINARTDGKILTGFTYDDKPVYLSDENQRNFSEAQRVAQIAPTKILPITVKLGEDEGGTPVYHTFETADELTSFYLTAVAYINQCLSDGWKEKDAIDYTEYETALKAL